MNAHHALVGIPGFHDLVVDPLAVGRSGPYEHHDAAASVHLVINPLHNGLVAPLCDRFPIVVRCRFVSLDSTDVPHLRNTPVVWDVMETVKNFSCHGGHPFKMIWKATRMAFMLLATTYCCHLPYTLRITCQPLISFKSTT